ncbi:putative two-component membrane permease complex subunit [Oxobacter pfennigii]|uniref:Putative two-component membrane permease complex subunit n=1 Tax=Oxobacter pfennigii TaxID=36849 RepID=A0A0P9AEW0_9CLOT|nr:permease [Oxobacter pfennigii]KPU43863.1 putative two-component membrane permease complex subunit [Oxobacter pfennigii]
MAIPVYVVTGFLDAGKTTFLNTLLNRRDWQDTGILVIQFEAGEEEFQSRYNNCYSISFPKKYLDQQPKQVIGQIVDAMRRHEFDEIWVEWNGVVPFSQLQALLLQPRLRNLCKIQKVIHIADGSSIENLLGRTGGALPEQIANSDFAVVRNVHSAAVYKRIRRLLDGINPGVEIYEIKAYKDLYKQLFRRRENPVNFFFLTVVMLAALYFSARSAFEALQIPFNTIINVFLGIILQAVPFLLMGVLLSSAIQVFIPQRIIERWFPKSLGMGMLAAIIGGFCLPVCDCASIPIFRSLVRKGIPVPVAVTFMAATPVINPVVILSTYYAFSGNMKIVVGRVFFGIIAAVIIGLIFALWPLKGQVLSGGALDRLMCSCGCYEDAESVTTFTGKLGLFIRHSQAEFFSVGKYLVIGTFIASLVQVLGTGIFTAAQSGAGLAVSIIIMMAMAFVLSLCSSSDAVIARSFANQFPMGAIMGFLVFGPMMDIKNVMMLSSGFSKRFIGKLLFTAFIVCFAVVFLLSGLGGM